MSAPSSAVTSQRGSLQGTLPPLHAPATTASSGSHSSHSAAAAAYKSFPSELNVPPAAAAVDRSQVSEKRRARLSGVRGNSASAAAAATAASYPSATAAAPADHGRSGGDSSGRRTGPSLVGYGAPPPMRLHTPLPHARATLHTHEQAIDLDLPERTAAGSASARIAASATATATAVAAPAPSSSSLGALTQDSNARLSEYLHQYEGKWRSELGQSESGGANSTMRLLMYGLVRLSDKEMEEEKEVSRRLLSWHPQRSAKTVANVQHKIKAIIAERGQMFEGARAGKALGEDERARDELAKRGSALYKVFVPATVGLLKLDVEVTDGRVEMYVSCGEVVTQSTYSREKSRCWLLRAGVGHHTMTLTSSDPSFRNGETYFIAFFAVTNATFTIKPSFGGKIKIGAAGADGSDGAGPASSGTRLTARQQNATRSAPSTKNIRKALDARIRAIQENSKTLAEFQNRVARMRRNGVPHLPGSDRPNSIHPPSLTLNQLRKLNEHEAGLEEAAAAAAEAEEQARASPSPLPSPRARPSNRTVRVPSPPRPASQPVALSPYSLDVIPHIQAIAGVSKLFFDTACEIGPPAPLLDEQGCIIVHDTLPSLTTPRRKSEATTDGAQGASSPPMPSSPTTTSLTLSLPHQPQPPRLERTLSLSSNMHSFIERVCKKLRVRAAQLMLSGQANHSARPHAQQARSSEEEEAVLQAHFIQRCLSIYAAHLSEIESILLAHASGDRSLPHVARLLPPPDGGPRPSAEKNFLLTNAFEATENRSYEPRMIQRRRQLWSQTHAARMSQAEEQHWRMQNEKREATLAVIQRKEQDRAAAHALKVAAEERRLLHERQSKWLLYVAAAVRFSWLCTARQHLQPMRVETFRKTCAAKKIQRFIRSALLIRRKTRASLHFQAFRSVMLLCAHNYGAVKRDRAADVIKLFLEQKTGVDSVTRLMKNFRRRVGICQRACRRWIASKRAKLQLWRMQYTRAVGALLDPNAAALLSAPSSTLPRDTVLLEEFALRKGEAMQAWDTYVRALQEHAAQLRDERAKASILPDHVIKVRPRPLAPHVPAVLSSAQLAGVLERVMQGVRNLARVQLQNSTANTSEQEAMAAALHKRTHGDAHTHGHGHGHHNSTELRSGPRHRKRDSLVVDATSSAKSSRPTSGRT